MGLSGTRRYALVGAVWAAVLVGPTVAGCGGDNGAGGSGDAGMDGGAQADSTMGSDARGDRSVGSDTGLPDTAARDTSTSGDVVSADTGTDSAPGTDAGTDGAGPDSPADAVAMDGAPGMDGSTDASDAQSDACVAETCGQLGLNCGTASDHCGGTVDCGSCTLPQTCGGGGTPNVCGMAMCMPRTCAQLGFNCGVALDGCGGLLNCGTCNLPEVCGGAMPNVCGVSPLCTGLCLQQQTCPNPSITTTVSGTVFAPGHVADPPFPQAGSADPLPRVLVYVPNAPVQPFTPGVACDTCGSVVSGSPLVSTLTDVHGNLTLTNMPVGANIPLVIQTGRWRRQVTIPSVPACTNTALPAPTTRLPRNRGEGDIPLMAIATGSIDAPECLLRKIGIDDPEFTVPTFMGGNGRVQIYTGVTAGGATIGGTLGPTEDQLWGLQSSINEYDAVFFPCQGSDSPESSSSQQTVINFTNAGGRLLATHYGYDWLYNDPPFSMTANWNVNQMPFPADQTAIINQSFPKGALLAGWAQYVGATTIVGQFSLLQHLADDVNGVIAPTQQWLTINNPSVTMLLTFNTPVGVQPANQCGRVAYADFHVDYLATPANPSVAFPSECTAGPMTPQEKLAEFSFFDLTACVSPDVANCMPRTCAQVGANCGPAGDGCGGVIQCGTCPSGQTCGGGGISGVCGTPSCTPVTCAQLAVQCGPAGDGCGGLLQCGSCPAGQTCGGGGSPGVCGTMSCVPRTCAQQNLHCGSGGDGCGNMINCGACPAGQTCGGSGMLGVCGAPACTPQTCAQRGYNCGAASDGCEGLVQCGNCPPPQTCGGGGAPNVCGG